METSIDLRNAVATSSSEKHLILKERDKQVRAALGLHMKKQTELSEAVDLRGTCPDMCPEMERYIREDRNQLSIFERLADSESSKQPLVDHRLAVKEYSRSSADQDLPLPHELRPGPVLQRTMHYLLNNIADRGGEGKWGDWFDFLWNRTRGIRKDITQQQLCDLTAVELVEKCARFHIYCGERLCEEDMMCFDAKINNENLTKCLQTLKELYEDLADKQIDCPNEAEFRAYMVLMNLNSGEILREVQQLREGLRHSNVIGFVVQVYSALNSNNYRRFFKLVKRASFLNACIMHRYFYQVRKKAFYIITRAYNKKEMCPVEDLARTLAFDTAEEALGFCTHHGLTIEGNLVVMDRAAFVEPETSYGPFRAQGLVETKQTVSIGETINGAPLPENIIPEPQQNSFDESGRFIGRELQKLPPKVQQSTTLFGRPTESEPAQGLFGATSGGASQSAFRRLTPDPPLAPRSKTPNARQQIEERTRARSATPDPIRPPGRASPAEPAARSGTPEPEQRSTVRFEKEIAKELFLEVIGEFTQSISTNLVRAVKMYLDYDKPIGDDYINSIVKEQVREISEETIDEYSQGVKEQEARNRAERSMRMRKAEAHVMETLCDEVVTAQVYKVAQQQCRENEAKLQKKSEERCTAHISDRLLTEVMCDVIDDVAGEVFESDVTARLAEQEANARAVQLMLTAKYFKRWKNKYFDRLRLKKSMLTFPATPALTNTKEQFKTLVPRSQGLVSRGVNLGVKRSRITLDSPLQLSEKRIRLEQNMALRDYWCEVRKDLVSAPIDVAQIVHQQLKISQKDAKKAKASLPFCGSKVYFKMMVALSKDKTYSKLQDWVCAKFSKGAVPNPPINGLTQYLSLYSANIEGKSVGLCVNAMHGIPTLAQSDQLHEETQFLNSVHDVLFVVDHNHYARIWGQEKERLRTLLETLHNQEAPALVVFCADKSVPHKDIEDRLDLVECEGQGLIASYSIHVLDCRWDQPPAIKTLRKAIRQAVVKSRDDYVIESLSPIEYVEHYLHKHFFSIVYEHQTKLPHCNEWTPFDLIDLYNDTVAHLGEVAANEQIFLSEVVCNNAPILEWRKSYQTNLRLPKLEVNTGESENSAQCVYRYVQTVASEFDMNKAVLYNRVSHVMSKWRRAQEYEIFPEHVSPPWISLIMACVEFKLAQLAAFVHRSEWDGDEEKLIYFRRSTLQDFKPPTLPYTTEVQFPANASKIDTPVLTESRLAIHTQQDARFSPLTLRDVILPHTQDQSRASSLICNVSQDTTTFSVTSADVVQRKQYGRRKMTDFDESSRLSGGDATVKFKNVLHGNRKRIAMESDRISVLSGEGDTTVRIEDIVKEETETEKEHKDLTKKFQWEAAREKNRNDQFEKYLQSMLETENKML